MLLYRVSFMLKGVIVTFDPYSIKKYKGRNVIPVQELADQYIKELRKLEQKHYPTWYYQECLNELKKKFDINI